MEETNWLFDEMFQKVWPGDIPELEPYKGYVRDDYDRLLDDILPYDLFYYYTNPYIMRYVNNYYSYDVYNPKVFKKNIEKAIDNYCNTQKEKAIEYARAEVVSIMDILQDKDIRVFHNGKEGTLYINYNWKTSKSDACKYCIKLNGKKFNSMKMVHAHWNCRCKIERNIRIIDDGGYILFEEKKVL